ncbi:MAG: sulfatase [Anaerolineae bacterium]
MKTSYFALLLVALLAACSAPTPNPPTPDLSTATAFIPSVTPTETVLPSPTTEPTTAIPSPSPSPAATATSVRVNRPNIIFILTDDLDTAELDYMPRVQSLLTRQGASFSNYFVNVSLCCPSRSTTLRGQYAQNTQIFTNDLPDGGYQKFHDVHDEDSTIAVWLQSAGYRTALIGKYLNGYPGNQPPTYVPPGWNEWDSPARGDPYGEYNYTLNENGKLVSYGATPQDYGTDVYAAKAINFVQRSIRNGKSFFLYLAPYAPHQPATPAPRHTNLFPDAQAPRTASYNEADVTTKPGYIRNRPLFTPARIRQIDNLYRRRLQSLQAVDEMVGHLIDTLKATGQLERTYFFFTSDNGFHLGQHRLEPGKNTPYEEDIRLPLVVRGPGIAAGSTIDSLTGNVDLALTWADLAGVKPPAFCDGRSLVPLWTGPITSWRQAFLLQRGPPTMTQQQAQEELERQILASAQNGTLEPPDDQGLLDASTPLPPRAIPPFQGLRTRDFTYVEYSTGERELYDLRSDPNELHNLAGTANPVFMAEMSARLAQLRACSGNTCRDIESQPFTTQP